MGLDGVMGEHGEFGTFICTGNVGKL